MPQSAVSVRDGNAHVFTIDDEDRARSQAAVEAHPRTRLRQSPGARIDVGRGGNGEQLMLTLASDDPVALAQAADAVEADLSTLPGVGNARLFTRRIRREAPVGGQAMPE